MVSRCSLRRSCGFGSNVAVPEQRRQQKVSVPVSDAVDATTKRLEDAKKIADMPPLLRTQLERARKRLERDAKRGTTYKFTASENYVATPDASKKERKLRGIVGRKAAKAFRKHLREQGIVL